ncbi:MAG TPA: ArsR family transcriptional regulator [archaeon]|nr:ArsR family transcriptional regulator [archaeon]
MDFADEIKIITREPNMVAARFALDSNYRRSPELIDRIKEGMGYPSKESLKHDHPYFSQSSLNDSLRLAVGPLTEGDEYQGYRIRRDEQGTLRKVDLGIHTVVASGISLDHFFGGNRSAENVAEILYALRDGKTKRIQDICNETGISVSVPGMHLARLSEVGIVYFAGYEPPRYRWNASIDSFNGVYKTIENELPGKTKHNILQRALEIAKRLYDSKGIDFNLTEVEHMVSDRFASGGSNRCLTACALRSLERMEYVKASNNFRGNDTNSQVSAVFDESGRNPLVDFVVMTKGEMEIPDMQVGWEQARQAIDIFASYYTRKSTPEQRKLEIIEYLTSRGRATRKDITSALKFSGAFGYLKQLEEEGRVVHENVKNVHHYSLASVPARNL